MKLGFAVCGSFCTFSSVFPIMELLASKNDIYPIFSFNASNIDSRFGKADSFMKRASDVTGHNVWKTISEVEPIGPKKLFDLLVIAPCTGNTLAKLANSIADTPVTMAAKSHLRNSRPVVIAISTNDALAGNAQNIGHLLSRKNFYFVPFRQDDPVSKPTSLIANFEKIPVTIQQALDGKQIQPILEIQ